MRKQGGGGGGGDYTLSFVHGVSRKRVHCMRFLHSVCVCVRASERERV